jgi:hypothetical protein
MINLDKLIEKTKTGEIVWSLVNAGRYECGYSHLSLLAVEGGVRVTSTGSAKRSSSYKVSTDLLIQAIEDVEKNRKAKQAKELKAELEELGLI